MSTKTFLASSARCPRPSTSRSCASTGARLRSSSKGRSAPESTSPCSSCEPPAGGFVELHTHPYSETFLLLEGKGRWTAGDDVVEPRPNSMLVVPPETPHGFRNIGDVPLLVVSVHESGVLDQTFLGIDPA